MSLAQPDAQPHAEVLTLPVPAAPASTSLSSRLPALLKQTTVTLTAAAVTPLTLSLDLVVLGAERGERLADQLGSLLGELTLTAQAVQRLLMALADAVEDGFLDEVRGGLRNISSAVELMATVSDQLDQAMPVLDATTPALKVMNSTLAQLDATIVSLEALPGVRMARRFVGRPASIESL